MEASLAAGRIIANRYRIEALIASGGMGHVYRANQLHIDRPVALKILDEEAFLSSRKELEERFIHEAKVIARIDHPNVIRIYDFGFFGSHDVPYLSMELLDGYDLQSRLDSGNRLTPRRAINFIQTALSALAAAHANAIIHKDIKPGNLFINNPRSAKENLILLDFGVARSQDLDQPAMTRAGEITGTPEYLAPEYITKQIVTPSMDIYAMAIILIELLMGKNLILGESITERLFAHLRGPIPLPSWIENSPLGPLLRHALEPDHNRRIQSADEFSKQLDAKKYEFVQYLKNLHENLPHPTAPLTKPQQARSSHSIPAPKSPKEITPATPPQQKMAEIFQPKTPPQQLQRKTAPHQPQAPLQRQVAPQRQATPQRQAAPQAPQPDFRSLFQSATNAYLGGDPKLALQFFQQCLSLHPQHPQVIHNIHIIRKQLHSH